MKNLSRRNFIQSGTLLGIAAAGLIPGSLQASKIFSPLPHPTDSVYAPDLSVYIFSKHLQFLDFKEMAEAAKQIGFAGVDLTLRPDGHVSPEKVEDDLPKAVEAMRASGLQVQMLTTSITSTEEPHTHKILKTAAKLGFKYYRTGWLKYPEDKSLPDALDMYEKQFKQLSKLNQQLGICGAYQNHAGNYVGAAIWDLYELLEDQSKEWLGVQYDVRHATVEGGYSWHQDLRLIQPYIKTLVIKDFVWEKKNNRWEAQSVPLGEGMVDFEKYFKFLQKYQVHVPVSLHLEYPLGGAEHGHKKLSMSPEEVFRAMKKDLETLQSLWKKASEG